MLRDEIIGTWQLVSYVAQDDHGGPVTYRRGPDAIGLIVCGHRSSTVSLIDRHAGRARGGTTSCLTELTCRTTAVGSIPAGAPTDHHQHTGSSWRDLRVSVHVAKT
jgi:hypothetical protein